jgi:hypothetical protein
VTPQLQIPEEAVDATMRQALIQVIDTVYNQMRSLISVKDIRVTGTELLHSEDLRKEMSVRQAFLTLDLFEIQRANWADLLSEEKERLDEILALRKVEIKASEVKIKKLREVELAEVALNKAKAEEDWDIALHRFRKVKGHLFVGAILLVAGFFLGQAIASFQQTPQATHSVKKMIPKK